MCGLELAKNIEKEKVLDNMSDAELNVEEARLQIRRTDLQAEIESVIEDLKGISEEKFKRSTTDK